MREIEIFSEAPLDGDDETLRVYLDEACGDDESMKGRVRELLKADQAAGGGSFMEDPPFEVVNDPDHGDLASGTLVGHYKLLQRIGEGAFGSVFMAEQLEPVKRRVAVKIIKLGMDTRQVVARFEVERQALAMMDHPNIARVYDAGATEAGRPYFVMELVRGIPITQFCEEQKLNTEERLALFLEVCSAVQHAHQKGIIHRDLKPSNVMVTLHDDKPVPKVIDFGVAKATQQDLTQKTLFTRFEQFIGTPAYMSPEQAEMSGLDIDTRSDIYSLGVLLYELLTGTTPLDANRLSSIGQDEMRRAIREEEPPLPSTRLTLRQNRANRDARETIPPTRIDRDLDWIVMKALEKDRKRRYDTANGLAADVRRYLAHEPVEAGAPTLAYRFGKYVRRNRAVVITGGTVAASLATAAVVSTLFFFSEKKAREEAVTSEARAVRVSLIARHAEAEGLLASGKKRLGMAKLAQLIREDDENLVAAERLLSALQRHDFTRVLHLFPNSQDAALSPDGSLLATSTADETGLQVWDARTGEPVGKALPDLPGYQGRDFGFDVSFHPSEPWLLTDHRETSSEVSCLRIYNYETGTVVGSPVVLEGKTYFARFSPSGRSLITGGSYRNSETRRNEAWVFDSATGEALFSIPGPVGRNALEGMFSPDESLVALIRDRRLTLCDAQSGAKLREIRHPSGLTIWDFAFSPDGRTIATASEDRTVRLWEVETGQLVGGPFFHAETVRALEFSQNGLLLASRSGNDWVHVWNVASGKPQFEPPIQVQGLLKAVHFHPKGHQLLTVDDRRVEIWDAASGKKVGDAVDRGLSFFGAQWSPTGNEILTFGLGGRSHLVKASVANPPCQEFHHPANPDSTERNGLVTSANFHPAGTHLVSGGRDKRARVWDVARGTQDREFFLGSGVEWVDYSPDGSLLLATWGSPGGGVRVWDTGTWKQMGSPPESGYVGFATFVPARDGGDGWEVLSAAGGSPPFLWNPGGTTPPTFFETDLRLTKSMVDAVARSRDGRLVATLSSANEVLLWDARTGDLVRRLDGDFGQKGHSDYVRSVCFSADDTRILTTSNDHTARVWETATGRQLIWPPMKHGEEVTYGTFSPGDEKWIATASRDGTARVWDATTGEPVGVPMQHESWVNHLAFDPRGERIITASDDGMDRVWDAATGFPLSEPMEHDGQSRYATFGPSGNRAVTVGLDSKVRLWELPQFPKRKVPDWVPRWIERVIGLRIDDSNRVVEVDHENPQQLEEWAFEMAKEDDFYGRFVRWFYESSETRPISPFAEVTQAQYVHHRMQDRTLAGEPVLESLREVIRIAPDHRSAHLELARMLLAMQDGDPIGNLERARYHAQVALSLSTGDDNRTMVDEAGTLLATIERRLTQIAVEGRCEALEKQAVDLRDAGEGAAALVLMRQATLERSKMAAQPDWWPPAEEAGELFANWVEFGRKEILVPKGSSWKYFDDPEASVPEGWQEPGFADEEWAEGPARHGFSRDGEDGEVTVLRKGLPGSERMAFYFRHHFQYDPNQTKLVPGALILSLLRDDGAVVYLNGQEILRSNMSVGKINEKSRASMTVGRNEEHTFIPCLTGRHHLRLGENVLAVEVHQSGPKSSDVSFDLEVALGEHPFPDDAVLPGEGELSDEQAAFLHWTFGGSAETIEAVERVLAPLVGSFEPAKVRQRKKWLRRKAWLLSSSDRELSRRLLEQVEAVPPRDPGLDSQCLDLGALYTSSLYEKSPPPPGSPAAALERLPETFDPKGGPSFDLRGWIELKGGDSGPDDSKDGTKPDPPAKVEIPVRRSCRKIHFLHGARTVKEDPGVVIARYRMHFEDGSGFEEAEMVLGRDVAGLWLSERPAQETVNLEGIAWTHPFRTNSRQATLGLTQMTWENRSGKTISHIEFISAGNETFPVLYAVTLE